GGGGRSGGGGGGARGGGWGGGGGGVRAAVHVERPSPRAPASRPGLGGGGGARRAGRDPHRDRSAGARPAPPVRRAHVARSRADADLVPAAPVSAGGPAGVLDVLPVRHLRPLSPPPHRRARVGRGMARLLARPHGCPG